MKMAVMQDGKNWIVDQYTELIMDNAPDDWEFTVFPHDVSWESLMVLAQENDLIYSSYWQPFLRTGFVTNARYPSDKVVIQVWHIMDPKHKAYDRTAKLLAHPNVKHICYPCRNTQERLALEGVTANLYKVDMCTTTEPDFFEPVPPPIKDMYIGNFSKVYLRKRFDVIQNALERMQGVQLITTHGQGGKNVKVLGQVTQKELESVFKSLHVYVSTSDEEGGPVGVLQAMAIGIPVVTTPTGFAYDLIRHNINGYVIPFNDPDALIERLAWIRLHWDQARKVGSAGRRTVAKYTPDRTVMQYLDVFRRIHHGKSSVDNRSDRAGR
jgi:glycosyltransferase involved in cell wall biosynthesis